MTDKIQLLIDSVSKVIVGKENVIKYTICSLLCEGHILIEDVPGVGKTQLVAALAKSVDGKFNRIQLTPDIMPSDILGFSIVNPKTYELEYRDGAAICNFLLADEINRASPKVQSSLLEVMEEHQISMDGVTHELPKPFMVLATQNPVETYGTYYLPEAQMDRFFMKISMGYPSKSEEMIILDRTEKYNPIKNITEPVIHLEDVISLQKEVKKVNVSQQVKKYILDIVFATRNDENITLGVSPRGSICLYKASKSYAYINGRDYVTPDDVKNMVYCVLSHRIILSPKGKTKYENTINYLKEVLARVEVPMSRV
ncbi:MAG: MoxR family ATPase [Clostridiales bacterium]|nr:MoxR family ATPase [Clostridiales bacterium]